MEPKILDCIGLPCPKPVLETKSALEQGEQLIQVLVDNDASKNNVTRFGNNQGCEVTTEEVAEGNFRITIKAGRKRQPTSFQQEEYQCELPASAGLVYVIPADTMGRGDDELGWALLQTFIQTIKDVSPLPHKILFYNSGVKLVTEHSGALDALQHLQQVGVEIFVCGTCLDFYNLKSAIKVGQISNMYDIMNSMTEASQVVCPH